MNCRTPVLRFAAVVLSTMIFVGCAATPHAEIGVCQECYDAVHKARVEHPSTGSNHNEVLGTYECPCCKSEMSVYIENGVHMVKCGGCAKDGVAWDHCSLSVHEPK
tara:strand:- start:1742 stop:2059 length:318 start_codon:yes stop_codon:yes gene_type:complete